MNRPTMNLVSTAMLVVAAGCSSKGHGLNAGSVDARAGADLMIDLPSGADGRGPRDSALDEVAVAPPSSCHLGETSDLPGVSFHVLLDDCTFSTAQARAGIRIPYEVTIEQDMDVVLAPSPGSYCYPPESNGLLILEQLSGGGQRYCLCDRGIPNQAFCQKSTPLHKGVYQASFEWDGVNWSGPSDTSNPKGAPFPIGSYRLEITAKGSWGLLDGGPSAFTVYAGFAINLVD